MDLLQQYIDSAKEALTKKINDTKPTPTKKSKKEWDWEKHKFIIDGNEELLARSALKLVSAKKKYRTFDGSLNKNKSFGPVDAIGMSSEVATSSDGSVDVGGYGVGEYGVTPFGEALNRNAKKIKKAILNAKFDQETLNTVLDGYSKIFQHFSENSNLIMHAIQPSFRDYFSFDIKDLVSGLNNYKGTIYSIVLSESYDMESVELIAKWMIDIGVDKKVVSKIVFIEKTNKCEFGYDNSFIPKYKRKSKYVNKILSIDDLSDLISVVKNPILIGNIDIYMIGETSLACSLKQVKYQIDSRYCYLL